MQLTIGLMIGLFLSQTALASSTCFPKGLKRAVAALQTRFEYEELPTQSTHMLTLYEASVDVGVSIYRIDGNTAFIELISVDAEHKRNGHSARLLHEILRRHPEINRIEAELADDNFIAYVGEREYGPQEHPFYRCLRQVQRTPAYKIRKALGFGKIASCVAGASSVLLAVVR